ncbi:Aste57867_18156 [Aphanomyces stellatus]|uniref:Aste57867_18156 protein n=1 Tax=Aphanomyces stellatus TaxID=120398 RepID=A0A485LD17_9STRA|nr:hypothetical protein As57867_018094 [Aphanomyces stellatus]VFT94894.1 Aste57867_18156 [Aphanomyces stellatus]
MHQVKRRGDIHPHLLDVYADVDDFEADMTLLSPQGKKTRSTSGAYSASMVPLTGISTFALAGACGCWLWFACPNDCPTTVSSAAELFPESKLFAFGLLWTAYFFYLTTHQFSIYLQRHLLCLTQLPSIYVMAGAIAALALTLLALLSHKRHRSIRFVVAAVFFASAWATICLGHLGRSRVSLSDPKGTLMLPGFRRGAFCILGSFFFFTGYCYSIMATDSYKLLGLSHVLEPSCLILAVVCQLLYMSTLFHEIQTLRDASEYMTAGDLVKVGLVIVVLVAGSSI